MVPARSLDFAVELERVLEETDEFDDWASREEGPAENATVLWGAPADAYDRVFVRTIVGSHQH